MTCVVMCAASLVYAAPTRPETGDVGNKNFMALKSAAVSIDKADGENSNFLVGCLLTLLAGGGGTSGNSRAPNPNFSAGRAVYLVTATEAQAAGLATGMQPGSIGWHYVTAPSASATVTLKIYLQNTSDTTNTKGTSWAAAIAPMTLVSNGSQSLPASTTPFDLTFSGGSPFTYTGNALYIAFEFTNPTVRTNTIVDCNVDQAGSLLGNNDATDVIAASTFRPMTRMTPAVGFPNDAAVDQVRSLGSVPLGLVGPQQFQAVVSNKGTSVASNVQVNLNVTGSNPFSDSVTIPSLAACTGAALVTFTGMPVTTIGSNTVTVSVGNDDNNANNSRAKPLNITGATYSYKYPGSTLNGGVGSTTGVLQLGARFNVTSATQVDTAYLEFAASVASTYRLAIYNDAGGVPGSLLYEDTSDRIPTAGPVAIRLNPPVAVPAGNFYIVAEQTNGTVNYSLSFDTENPLRTGAFFAATAIPAGAWGDLAPANTFKLNLGAAVGACLAPPVVSVTPSSASVCQGGQLQFTCNISGATGNTNIQWTENGVNISGQTGTTLTVSKPGPGSFSYNCKVTDDAACSNIIDPTPAVGTWLANGAACEDGNSCTGPDTCGGGTCQPGPNPCNDSNACTNDICDGVGGCTYTAVNCDDSNVCTSDSCDIGLGCQHANVAGPCTDGNVCTVGDSCAAGACVPGPVPSPVQFCNAAAITIGTGAGSPYPTSVTASGLNTILCKATVNLNNLSHSWPEDIDMLLAGPTKNATIFSDTGGGNPGIANVNMTLDDAAPTPIPDANFGSGSYQPTNLSGADAFPAPAPTPLNASALSTFNGINPNGTWSLYIVDDSAGDTGALAGGWCINIIAAPCTTIADCSDGNACTTDTCTAGACGHTPVSCADGDACTDDTCDTNTGLCPHAPTNCDDGNVCTTDSCSSGSGCAHAQVPNSQVTNLKFAANKHAITWDAVPNPPYDIIYGDLQLLHSSGITASTGGCLGDNGASPSSDDSDTPGPGQGFWYLSRSRGCGGVTGTYNEGGNQVGNRDTSVPAPPIDCSRP